jgi:DNA polymerase-3 subunit delta
VNIVEALEILEHGNLGPCYLLSGENSYWARQWIERARKHFLEDGYEDGFIVKEAVNSWSGLDMELRTTGFFTRRRMVVIKDAQWPQKDESLSNYLQHPDPEALLVIWDKKPSSALSKVFGPERFVELKPLPPHLYHRFVQREIKSRGLRVSSAAMDLISEFVLHDEQQVLYELDKMMLYDPGRKWDEESVRRFVTPMPHDTKLWRLTEPLAQRHRSETVAEAQELLREGKAPLLIFIVAIRHLIKLNHALKAKQRGISLQEFAREEGMKEFPAKKIWQHAQYWSLQEIAELLRLGAFVDRSLKTGFGDSETWVIMYMAMTGKQKPK